MTEKTHSLVVSTPVLYAEEGFILGNGDISVSVYQVGDTIRLRLGKGDVWDRRVDFSKDPEPASIAEVARGITEEGWTCGPYGGPVHATRGTGDPARMKDLCQGTPPSYSENPFPCPKPVGELWIHLSGDRHGLKVRHQLFIERSVLEVFCEWENGSSLVVEIVVHPELNQVGVSWHNNEAENHSPFGGRIEGLPAPLPIWFSLRRHADTDIEKFSQQHFADNRHPHFFSSAKSMANPLPPPRILEVAASPILVQTFPDDPDFAGGFAYALAAGGDELSIHAAQADSSGVTIHLLPESSSVSGEVYVAVASTANGDKNRLAAEPVECLGMTEACSARSLVDSANYREIASASRSAAERFWSRSRIRLEDKFLEDLWYSSLHTKRCILRAEKCPPGLFLPSTVRDYSLWHGDYHTNYNFQSIFLGDYVANHEEIGDAYFNGIEYFWSIGRKIAHEYYGCRGAFVQLSGFPCHLNHDPIGTVPMGRMAYMTGWVAAGYFGRWLHFKDRQWLEFNGYPIVRELALFYTDFLKLAEDGLYHAFPSNQGEDGFSDDPQLYTDRPQVIRHGRYCMQAALKMAGELNVDLALQNEWTERLEKLAPEDGDAKKQFLLLPDKKFGLLPPEYLGFDGLMPPRASCQPPAFLSPGHDYYEWYPGKIPYEWMIQQRNGSWNGDRDLPAMKSLLKRWVHPNGQLWAMAISNYGRAGGWTETLGIIGAIQDLLIQSWGGVIELFSGWPTALSASFQNLRAEGAFLVSSEKSGHLVMNVSIFSEQGGVCVLKNPWQGECVLHVSDLDSEQGLIQPTDNDLLVFEMEQDSTIRLTRSI